MPSSPQFPGSLLAQALDTISEGSLITDGQQNTLYSNVAFSVISGYDRQEMLGQNCRILQGPETDREMVAMLRRCLEAGETFRGRLLNYRKDGTPFWNDLTITPLFDDDGEIRHFVSVQKDVTRDVVLQEEFRLKAAKKDMSFEELLMSGGLSMVMQPIVNLQTNSVKHVEALARLRLPDDALVAPDVFLPSFGKMEMDNLFRLGLDQALRWLTHWEAEGVHLNVSINLLPSTLLDPECLGWIEETLERYGLDPARLTLEVLETGDIVGPVSHERIDRLRWLGIRLAMDDLGSGYSSLMRFAKLPFDIVKIDPHLTDLINNDSAPGLILLGSLINIGKGFKRDVVVEGLETPGAINAARALGAQYGQGNGIALPMLPSAVPGWVRGFNASIPTSRPDLEGEALMDWLLKQVK